MGTTRVQLDDMNMHLFNSKTLTSIFYIDMYSDAPIYTWR